MGSRCKYIAYTYRYKCKVKLLHNFFVFEKQVVNPVCDFTAHCITMDTNIQRKIKYVIKVNIKKNKIGKIYF